MTAAPPPRRGRPRRIDREAIVEAVLAVGAERVTMRAVAARLGVSVPGLYHHVRNTDELLALAAHGALARSAPPRYDGGHWAVWLRTYARYVRGALAAEPALLEKFLSGAVTHDDEMTYIADAVEALHGQGLDAEDALTVWAAVTAMAMGSVAEAHRERVQAERGAPWQQRISATAAASEHHGALRRLAQRAVSPFDDRAFEQRITLLLNGIATQYGLPPPPADPVGVR